MSTCNVVGIGVDVETVFSEQEADLLHDQISNRKEMSLLTCQVHITLACTIIFSLKEAVFKAVYPAFYTYFGFHSLLIEDFDLEFGIATIKIIGDVGNRV